MLRSGSFWEGQAWPQKPPSFTPRPLLRAGFRGPFMAGGRGGPRREQDRGRECLLDLAPLW